MSDTPSTPVVADVGVSDSPPTPDPCTIVIFGASGDLAKRELFPALFSLHRQDLLPDGCRIVGVAREPWKMEDFRTHVMRKVRQSVEHEEAWPAFAKRVRFIRGDADTAEDYTSLAAT